VLTEQEIQFALANIHRLTADEQARLLSVLEELERRKHAKRCQDDLLTFCQHMDPSYVIATHHKRLAELLTNIAYGLKDRIAVSIPPRHGKSHLISTLFPAWFLGKFPSKKVLMVSHTGDLAVDFGRKVRNLIDDPRYKSVFPAITLAADSKSAGRWSTNAGGEYFACLRLHTGVHTTRGVVAASDVRIGDNLLNAGTPVKVLQIYNSIHDATFRVAGLECSADHPIWTMNRGWVQAAKILPSDLLRVESISDKMQALLWRAYGYLEHPCVPALVQHQVPLRESKQQKIPFVRSAWNLALRTVAVVRNFLGRYGTPTFTYTYCGANRQRWTVQPRKLSVGNAYRASQQQANKRADWKQDVSGACSGVRNTAGNYTLSLSEWHGPIEQQKETQEELRTYDPPKRLGWLAVAGASFLTTCRRINQSTKPKSGLKRHLAGIREHAQKLCGLLLGVRPAGDIEKITTPSEQFVNFLTDGDHTFFVEGVLTHNCGVGAALAGRGADLLLIDDPHSEQDLLAGNFDELEKTYQWFAFGARTRLMSGGRVAVVHTRWHQDDLIGHLIKDGANNPKADQYEVFEFPAILTVEKEGPDGVEVVEKALWPEKFDLQTLERTKASMPLFQWNAQYMQNPTGEQGAIIQRDWWRPWKLDDPPQCDFVIMTLDAAAEKNNRADFTALLTWGVFTDDNHTNGEPHIILLNAINVRVEFPELKDLAIREWNEWEPEAFIVEKKSSGVPLYQELRRMGIPVQEFTPHRGTGDKVARLSAVADIIRSGMVWYPEGRRWAEEVIEQCVAFPFGSHDDMVDCTSMALARFRQGGLIGLPSDFREPQHFQARRAAYY
jgi:predicted phage terminase large subunit-like protein